MIVGLAGRSGSGKDVVARYLGGRLGFVIRRFSEALKQELVERFPRTLRLIVQEVYNLDTVDIQDVRDMVWEHRPLIVRSLLQEYGTQVRRRDDPRYWLDRWVESLPEARYPIVVPDVRFKNECRLIEDLGGRVIRIVRLGNVGAGDHESEVDLDSIRLPIVMNLGTPEQLGYQVAHLLNLE